MARIPTPPAFETLATSSGLEIQDIPGSNIGCLHLNRFVKRVLIVDAAIVSGSFRMLSDRGEEIYPSMGRSQGNTKREKSCQNSFFFSRIIRMKKILVLKFD